MSSILFSAEEFVGYLLVLPCLMILVHRPLQHCSLEKGKITKDSVRSKMNNQVTPPKQASTRISDQGKSTTGGKGDDEYQLQPSDQLLPQGLYCVPPVHLLSSLLLFFPFSRHCILKCKESVTGESEHRVGLEWVRVVQGVHCDRPKKCIVHVLSPCPGQLLLLTVSSSYATHPWDKP